MSFGSKLRLDFQIIKALIGRKGIIFGSLHNAKRYDDMCRELDKFVYKRRKKYEDRVGHDHAPDWQ